MGIGLHVHSHHSRFSLLRNEKRTKDAKQGRLASTIRPQKSEDLIFFNGEGDVLSAWRRP